MLFQYKKISKISQILNLNVQVQKKAKNTFRSKAAFPCFGVIDLVRLLILLNYFKFKNTVSATPIIASEIGYAWTVTVVALPIGGDVYSGPAVSEDVGIISFPKPKPINLNLIYANFVAARHM